MGSSFRKSASHGLVIQAMDRKATCPFRFGQE